MFSINSTYKINFVILCCLCVISFLTGWIILREQPSSLRTTSTTVVSQELQVNTKVLAKQTEKAKQTDPNVTVVTAYFDIGTFPKGNTNLLFTRSTYDNWAATFHYLRNHLVVYTDSEKFKQHMLTIRKDLMVRTKIVVIDRSSSWAFRNIDRIKAIYASEGYPKHYPNTVIPEYACAQHAKSDVVSRAAEANVFGTKYFMWLDVGYFRDRVNSNQSFYLSKPSGFDDRKIAMNRIYYNHKLSADPKSIFLKNLVYVGGGVVFGERKQMIRFSSQVKRAVEYFLTQNLMNTDQQVIYAMFSDEGKKVIKPEVEIQYYSSPTDFKWFYLGYSMVRTLDSNM